MNPGEGASTPCDLIAFGARSLRPCQVAVGLDGTLLAVDTETAAALGTAPETMVGRPVWRFLPGRTADDWTRLVARLEAEGRESGTAPLWTADGSSRVLSGTIALLEHATRGRYVFVSGVIDDPPPTATARTEAHRRAFVGPLNGHDRELFEAVVKASVAAIVMVDAAGQLVFANSHAEEILGLEASSLLDRRYDDPRWRATDLDGGPWPDEKQPFVQVMQTRSAVYDVRHAIEWPDGRRRALSINGEPLFDAHGELTRILFTITDISKQLAADQALRDSEERLRDVLDRVSAGVVVQGPAAEMLMWNRAALELLGLTDDQIAGRTSFDPTWNVVREDGRLFPGVEHPVPRAIETRAPVRDVVMGVGWSGLDDRRVWLLVNATPRLDEQGRVIDVVCDFRDFSVRKKLEESMRRSDRLEGLGRLAGGVAHDFNNLLTAVVGNAELAAGSLPVSHPVQTDLDEIRDAARRGSALTAQLLGYARKQVTRPRVVSLVEVVRASANLIERVIGEDIDVRIEAADGLWPVRIDPDQFDQVLVNLAVNARQAMPRGGRLVLSVGNVDAGDLTPAWPEARDRHYVRLRVDDEGPGMAPEVAERAFEPFFTTRPPGEGTGLGLAMCYGIVRQNEGLIRVASTPAGGCRIEILLPRRVTGPIAAVAGPLPRATGRGSERILLVEDNAGVRHMARRVLTGRGYRVHAVGDGRSALQLLEGPNPPVFDILVTDIVMPGMSGPELARAVAARAPDMPVVFTSGHARGLLGDLDEGPETRFLSKPYTSHALLMAVRAALDAR